MRHPVSDASIDKQEGTVQQQTEAAAYHRRVPTVAGLLSAEKPSGHVEAASTCAGRESSSDNQVVLRFDFINSRDTRVQSS